MTELDLLDLLEETKHNLPCRTLFATATRGVQERYAEWLSWRNEYGEFGSIPRSHAWLPEATGFTGHDPLEELTSRCMPAVLLASMWCEHHGRCYCVSNGNLARGACFGCTWEGAPAEHTSVAVADAHDHAWPGWRDLPPVPRRPDRGTSKREIEAMDAWEAHVRAVYPDGWLDAGGPIVTVRDPLGTRDIPFHTGHGGYDLAARPCHLEASAS